MLPLAGRRVLGASSGLARRRREGGRLGTPARQGFGGGWLLVGYTDGLRRRQGAAPWVAAAGADLGVVLAALLPLGGGG